MLDPVRHVVVDANILASYFIPSSVNNPVLLQRCNSLLSAGIHARWPGIRLYTPSICIAETMSVIDKYRFCTWAGPLKKNPADQLTTAEYSKARNRLADVVKNRLIERLSHDHEHVLFSGLISPVNNSHQIRRRKAGSTKRHDGIKPPMGAADCLIVGLTVHLVSRLGAKSVLLVTADQRLADVTNRAKSIKPQTASKLGLIDAAQQVGLEWSTQLYPTCVNLAKATDSELQKLFGGWPLPEVTFIEKTRGELSDTEKRELANIWLEVARQHGISNPDRLPYSIALEQIRVIFTARFGIYLSSDDVFWVLVNLRKATKLPKP